MLETFSVSEFRSCDGYHRSTADVPARCPIDSILTAPRLTSFRPRVLVVEFRDEVYAGIKSVLEDHDCHVARAEFGAAVAGTLIRFSPNLVLVNESMPDESGWLVAAKLQVMRFQQPVWLYAVRRPHPLAAWAEFSGVSRVIDYGGVLFRLLDHVRQHLAQWMRSLDSDPDYGKSPVASAVVA